MPNISKYLLNGHKTQQQTVQNLFQSVQLNINNPNFLIMQGRITKVGIVVAQLFVHAISHLGRSST